MMKYLKYAVFALLVASGFLGGRYVGYRQAVREQKPCPPAVANNVTIGKIKGNSGGSLDVAQRATMTRVDTVYLPCDSLPLSKRQQRKLERWMRKSKTN